MIEQALHDRLAVIERAVDRERMDVLLLRRRHHAPLHVRDAAMRIERDQVDLIAAAERLDRSAAGIARGRDHDRRALAALDQRMIHQPRQELHREVLERERRPVKQLQHKGAGRDLRKRRNGRVAERAVGVVRHAGEFRVRNGAADEGAHDLAGDFGVGLAGQRRNLRGGKNRPGLRHIEAAVAGEPGQSHIDEAERGGFASGGNVAQRRVFRWFVATLEGQAAPHKESK